MTLVDRLAEAQIQKAIDNGELDHLPGSGIEYNLADDGISCDPRCHWLPPGGHSGRRSRSPRHAVRRVR
jgi:hypothetical protein